MKTSRYLLISFLFMVCACTQNEFLDQALHSTKPITILVGYVPGAEPPLLPTKGASVNPFDFLCTNVQALFPGKNCLAPRALPQMTRLTVESNDHRFYSTDHILKIAEQLGDDPTVVRIVILDGRAKDADCYNGASCSLGKTVEAGSQRVIALFWPAIVDQANHESRPQHAAAYSIYLLSRVVTHEFGHIAGLVNHGVPMIVAHESITKSVRHCSNPHCGMYFTGSDLSFNDWLASHQLGNQVDVQFDRNCLIDIHAASTY